MPVRYYQEFDDIDASGTPLRREISIATVSDAVTLPDNRGAGRTLDKALVWGGERLERVITSVLSRTGRGPKSSIKDIIQAVYQSLMMPRACRAELWRCGYWGPPGEIAAPPTVYELPVVCEWLAYAANAPHCPRCGARMTEQDILAPLKSSKKLVKLMSATNKSSSYISLQLLTLLVTIFPSSREDFADMGAWDVLQGLSRRMSDQLDLDPLLASSRRALVSLADAEILSHGKQLEAMVGVNEGPYFDRSLSELIQHFSHPEKMALALTIAHRYPISLYIKLPPTTYPMLFNRLVSSSDPVEIAVLTDSIYRSIDAMYTILGVPWLVEIIIITTQPQLLEHMPYRLHSLILDLPARYERYEQEAINMEQNFGRGVDPGRREILATRSRPSGRRARQRLGLLQAGSSG